MRPKDATDLSVEARAAAFLKALAIVGTDVVTAFERLDGDAMVKGYAWRALRLAIGSTPPVLWQRRAGRGAILATINRAVAISAAPRHMHPGLIEQGESGEKWIVAQRLAAWKARTDRAVDNGHNKPDAAANELRNRPANPWHAGCFSFSTTTPRRK